MTKTKKQHYVPQFLLRKFATKSKKNPQIWALDKKTQTVRLSSIRDVAHENNFYEYSSSNGSRINLENLMAGIDGIGARIVRQIIESGKLLLSKEDRIWFSCFIACQMSRTPMIRKDMENLRQMIIHKWGPNVRAMGDDRPIGSLSPDDAKASSLLHLQDVPEFAKIIESKVWTISEAPKDCPFIIGDNPVTRTNMIKRRFRGNLGLNNKGIELYMPLSPKYCIHIICPILAEAVLRTPELADVYINAITTGSPISLLPENAEFANSLQVIWSERFVYGREVSHLDTPLDMLRTNPELIEGPGVRQRPEDA